MATAFQFGATLSRLHGKVDFDMRLLSETSTPLNTTQAVEYLDAAASILTNTLANLGAGIVPEDVLTQSERDELAELILAYATAECQRTMRRTGEPYRIARDIWEKGLRALRATPSVTLGATPSISHNIPITCATTSCALPRARRFGGRHWKA